MRGDRTTETIAHFIGLFRTNPDQLRHRDTYEEFDARGKSIDLEDLSTLAVEIDTGHSLVKSAPGKSAADFTTASGLHAPHSGPQGTEVARLASADDSGSQAGSGEQRNDPVASTQAAESGTSMRAPVPGAPDAMMTVTIQRAELQDNDLLGTGTFRDVSVHAADLSAAADLAAALQAPAGPGPAEVPDLSFAQQLAATMQGFAPSAPSGATIFTSSALDDAAATVTIVDGVADTTAPTWNELLPLYHAKGKEGEADDPLPAWSLPSRYTPDDDRPEGHQIVAGGNLLVNEARIVDAWIDAPAIAVGGSWMNLGVISQVATVSNRDSGAAVAQAAPATVHQAIEIETLSRVAPWQIKTGSDAPLAPSRISIDVFHGDFVVSNFIKQSVEILDNDHFRMEITGANAAYVLGANTIANVTSIIAAGSGYDLILVQGDYITINTIHQTVVLQDDDVIEGPQAAGAGAAPTAKPVEDQALADVAARSFEGTATKSAGVDIGADEDDPAISSGIEADAPEVSGSEPAPDNLVMNDAKLITHGVDTAAPLGASLAEALADTSQDLESLMARLMDDPALSGLEQARVLKIDGNFVHTSTIQQILHLSDRDDIRTEGTVPAGLEIIAGQNALLNVASLTLKGVDSQIMAAEDSYSDLLIHQAGFVDEPDLQQRLDEGYVNEALAFLTEDAAAEAILRLEDQQDAGTAGSADAYDAMQAMLT